VKLVLYAASTPHASEVAETVRRLGHELAAVVRNRPGAPVPPELGPVTEIAALDPSLLALPFAVPQSDPGWRRAALEDARAHGFGDPCTLVDPTAVVASSAVLGPACYVGAMSVIGAGARVGPGCLVDRSCSLADHVRLGELVCTGPGVVIAGSVRVDDGAFLGAGAVIAPERTIGSGAIIGAGAVVVRDVSAGDVVAGNPAKVLRRVDDGPA
jgi:sugar O-acyltransferase (sialic acid O-acetyltransferase NeuD family)